MAKTNKPSAAPQEEAKPQANPAEAFLISKGIDPPIKSAPVHNISFEQLCDLLIEYKEV